MEQVIGKLHIVSDSYTRPADTAVYADGDTISNSTSAPRVLTFAGAIRNGNSVLQYATLTSSVNAATKLAADLWLFDTAPTPINDNDAFSISDAQMLACVGVVPFLSSDWRSSALNALCPAANLGIPIGGTALGMNAANKDLYGILVPRNAYTPASGEVLTVSLKFLD